MARWVLLLAVLGACSDDEPPLSNLTSLDCPVPGNLPFRLASHGFQNESNGSLTTSNPRFKDEAADVIGNPGGLVASIYLNTGDAATAMPVDYHGRKARTTTIGGLFAHALGGENVSLWSYDGTMWNAVGRTTTDADGYYDLPTTGFTAASGQPVYAVLEADGSCAEHYDYMLPAGSKVVVTDIDGTLTHDDTQLLMQIGDETYVPIMMGGADLLTQTWAAKRYPIIYLTARPHVFRNETRVWLRDLAFATGPLVTAEEVGDAGVYKTAWLDRMITDFGWNVVAAYGNAATDITAYENVAIPKAQTFIVGDLAGQNGTTPIANFDFSDHIATYVAGQPENN